MSQDQNNIDPPKRAIQFFEWYCYPPLLDSILGDLYERFDQNLEKHGSRKAKMKFWLDVFRFMNRHTLQRKGYSKFYNNSMSILNNYFKVGFRNLLKYRSFTAINVLGLSISMAVCLVIILMINDQLSYDRFQANKDNIYRFTHRRDAGIDIGMATVPQPLGQTLEEEFPGFEHVVNFRRFAGEVLQDGKALNIQGLFTDPSLFQLFSFPLAQGNPSTALSAPNSIVLKEEIAQKFFRDENPIGKTLKVGDLGVFEVTGVLEKLSGKSHINFEAFVSMSSVKLLEQEGLLAKASQNWASTSGTWTYFMLKDGFSNDNIVPLLNKLEKEHYNEDSDYRVDFGIQKMTDITPGPLYGNQIGTSMPNFFVIGLGVLATLIIICAAFNYTNLSAARALTRTKEVGVRKVMGARKGQLTIQFIVESILVSLFALIVSIVLLQVLIPAFEGLQMSSLLEWNLQLTGKAYFQFLGFGLLVGLVTGIFPSLYLSSFKPLNAMRNIVTSKKLSGWGMRKALIVSQFAISIVLIVSSLLVYKQIKFMVEKDYGYVKENIINIELQGQDYDRLKVELQKLSFVQNVSAASYIPNTGQFSDTKIQKNGSTEEIDINYFAVDDTYISNLNLELIAGRNFEKNANSINTKSLIMNEKAVQSLGFDRAIDAVGQPAAISGDSTSYNIIGVVKDYNYMILFSEIQPMMLTFRPEEYQFAQVKISGFDITRELTELEKIWDAFDPNHEIIAKTFQGQIDEFNAFFYDILYIVGLIAILSISIAGMGLLGISSYAIQIRLKEVSIRKVLGASAKTLVMLLSKSFIIMLSIAFIIGFSIAYLGNNAWLNQFAYRTDFGFEVFLLTAFSMFAIGALTIGWQALRATTTNPATSLRDD